MLRQEEISSEGSSEEESSSVEEICLPCCDKRNYLSHGLHYGMIGFAITSGVTLTGAGIFLALSLFTPEPNTKTYLQNAAIGMGGSGVAGLTACASLLLFGTKKAPAFDLAESEADRLINSMVGLTSIVIN